MCLKKQSNVTAYSENVNNHNYISVCIEAETKYSMLTMEQYILIYW